MFLSADVYNQTFANAYSISAQIIGVLTICLNSILIYVILKKTPKLMISLKVYLIPYCLYTIIFEVVFIIYVPYILHPFVYFIPIGLAKFLPKTIGLLIVTFGVAAALGLIDCCLGVLLERFFALKNAQKINHLPSKIPIIYFIISIISNLICILVAAIIICIPQISDIIIIPANEISTIITSSIFGLDTIIDVTLILSFQGTSQNGLPLFVIIFGIFASARAIALVIILLFNTHMTFKLKAKLSPESLKNNQMILKMNLIQLLALGIFIGAPVILICGIFWIFKDPCFFVNSLFGLMNCFGMVNTIITIACIKPYYLYFRGWIPSLKYTNVKVVRISSVQSVNQIVLY